MRQFKIIVEKHPDGYVAYPLGVKGVVVGEGDTYEEALADVKSARASILPLSGLMSLRLSRLFLKLSSRRREYNRS